MMYYNRLSCTSCMEISNEESDKWLLRGEQNHASDLLPVIWALPKMTKLFTVSTDTPICGLLQ